MISLDDVGIVALGSNLRGEHGSSLALLEAAVARLPRAGFRVLKLSNWWRSSAWPNPADPDYLNGVALVETTLTPRGALNALLNLEAEFGRRRGVANAPRTLDLDLIALGRLVKVDDDLILPHPKAHERVFVMGPLAEIAPTWVHPVLGQTAAALQAAAPIGREASAQPALSLPNGAQPST